MRLRDQNIHLGTGIVAEMSTDILTLRIRPERSTYISVNVNKYYVSAPDLRTLSPCKVRGRGHDLAACGLSAGQLILQAAALLEGTL